MSIRDFEDGACDWMDDGACRAPGVDPEWFFSESAAAIARAKQVCAGCPVAEPCRAYAVEHKEHGVWGGTDYKERRYARLAARPLPATCRNGHDLTPDNVVVRNDGGRRCRACWRANWHAHKERLELIRGGRS